jgi:hypothetical protein
MKNCGHIHKTASGNANQTAKMKVGWTYTEGFFCHRWKDFELEPPRGRPRKIWRRKKEEKAELMGKIWLKSWGEATIIYGNESFGVASWRPHAAKWSNDIDFIWSKHAATVKLCTVLRWHRKFSCSFDISRPLTSKYTVSTHLLSNISYSSIHLECQSHGLTLSLHIACSTNGYIAVQEWVRHRSFRKVRGSNLGLGTLDDRTFVAESEID